MPKNLKTIKEDSKKKNLKSQNIKTKKIKENKQLIKKVKKWELKDYHIVTPKDKTREPFIRSNPDKKKNNNLDPKIKKLK